MKMTWNHAVALKALLEHDPQRIYGLELLGLTKMSSGTLYPLLHRFEDEGWLRSTLEKIDTREAGRPARIYYRLTALGRKAGRAELERVRERYGL